MPTAIEFNNISKLYRLGLVSTETIVDDLKRWWTMNILRKEDPFLTVGSENDRSTAADSDYVWALKDIDFKVEQGDVVGIIGKNGAGKSTLLKILSKITAPTTGTIKAKGRIGSLLEVGTGFHGEMTGRENIFLNGAILGMTKPEIARKLDEIIDFSGCERYVDTPVKRYSSGMKVRLGFAVAAFLDPEILVVDEVLAVGDMEFRRKAISKIKELSRGEGRTALFVSHDLSSVNKLCKTGLVLNNGSIDYYGTVGGAIEHYMKTNQALNIEEGMALGANRKGNGMLRFTEILVMDKDGTRRNVFEVGEECVIRIGFEASDFLETSNLSSISVGFNTLDGIRVAWMGTALLADKIDASARTATFRIPRLMLNEGVYNLILIARVDGMEADFVRNVAQIEMVFQDYFGTGKNPPKDVNVMGYTFLDYGISLE